MACFTSTHVTCRVAHLAGQMSCVCVCVCVCVAACLQRCWTARQVDKYTGRQADRYTGRDIGSLALSPSS
jgi:hypothetical protein